MTPLQVLVKFGDGIPHDFQGMAMLHWERWMRERGCIASVEKETMPDDVKRRSMMTIEERDKL